VLNNEMLTDRKWWSYCT